MTKRRLISSLSPTEEQIGYSRAVVQGNWVHVSATSGFDFETMTIADDVVEQVEQCMRNIGRVLEQAGAGFADIVRVRYLVPNPSDFPRCWPVLRRYFGEVRPAATMISCSLGDPRILFEAEVTAQLTPSG